MYMCIYYTGPPGPRSPLRGCPQGGRVPPVNGTPAQLEVREI